jgi:hypothetical protein
MDRRAFLQAVSASVLSLPIVVEGPPTGRVYRVGMLGVDRRPIKDQPIPGVIAARLRDLGWEEGRNLSIDHRSATSPMRCRDSRIA